MGGIGQGIDPPALPSGKGPGTRLTGGLMGIRAVLGGCRISHPHRVSIPGTSYLYLVTMPPASSRPTLQNRSLQIICKESCVFAPASRTLRAGFLKSLVGGPAIVITLQENPRNEHNYLIFVIAVTILNYKIETSGE